jgi:hypothetical protein
MDLAAKLQIKPGTAVSVLAAPEAGPDLSGVGRPAREPAEAEAVIAFVQHSADLAGSAAVAAARLDKLTWIAYPKAGQLGTDLNRDRLASTVQDLGIRPVRQVSLDDVWSALRMRPA